MNALRLAPLAATILSVLCAATPLRAQRAEFWRCKHVLAEDGKSWRDDVVVVTVLDRIVEVRAVRQGDQFSRDFGERWLIPGLIDLHTHLLLQPYDLEKWDDQVRNDSDGLRTLRAVKFADRTLRAGFLAIRDLGTEGAGYADVDLIKGMAEGRLRGPRVYPATRAIVQRGRYGPEPNDPAVKKGAQCVAGIDEIRAAVREQVARGAVWIKVYADYGYGPGGSVAPTFSLEELQALCAEAKRLGRPVAAHAQTDEGMRRAVLAGVATIEHGAGGSEATFALMKQKGVVLCPCLAANEAIVRYAGHQGPIVERLNAAKLGFQRALAAGVTIACGSDAGVFAHGDNAHELELMVAYGMTPDQALIAATVTAAKVLGADDLGAVRAGAHGFVVLDADPMADVAALRKVHAVVREGDELLRKAW